MTANAPYYQMRGQFTNGANAQFVPDDVDDYDLSASITPQEAASLYTERQPSETPINTLEENHNLVELLEAATTAAGQAAQAMDVDTSGDSAAIPSKGKRKRGSSPSADAQGDAAPGAKRARIDLPTDPQLRGADNSMRGRSESSSLPPSSELMDNARAAGVHSAAALFRRSSEKSSRKYTRPPMSKLFMSLQLTPENFLHLQAQAKTYMLDPAHPERQNCVGNRGKGDTDMVKLRLFNCVRDFLNDGVGERFFGEYVEKPGEKDAIEAARALGEEKSSRDDKLVWPRDGNKIISLVTPLLRRMVTNERQRMYAIETRKGGAKKKEGSVEATQAQDSHPGMSDDNNQRQQSEQPQTIFDSTNFHPLAPLQSQILQPPIVPSAPSLPVHSPEINQAIYPHITTAHPTKAISNRSAIELSPGLKLPLPIQPPTEPHLQRINIFLAKKGIRLARVIRLEAAPPDEPLFNYQWTELRTRIDNLIRENALLYPELQEELNNLSSMGPEALRGLAVAASEIHATSTANNNEGLESANGSATARNDSVAIGMIPDVVSDDASTRALLSDSRQSSPPAQTPASMTSPSSVLPSGRLPPYRITSMSTLGLREIMNESDWIELKSDIAHAVWADGVCNLVVELD
ncbi:hypothetical protein BU26DRAFT_150323 [Trematosphaeria pertusa]|uniref:Uncharacterized protein n=1 Tax=Trematosphaeria pertusa TaxID=390896 RepID=A0A6A6IWY8_9PLEO|nr:uncharacterized protein BU26DRAFT_150323 [Trematosphaeria pertusa]KAF2255061.1 hypothetical protein BU26DRAFT_150323 [Trematosphaeria pertusa]